MDMYMYGLRIDIQLHKCSSATTCRLDVAVMACADSLLASCHLQMHDFAYVASPLANGMFIMSA